MALSFLLPLSLILAGFNLTFPYFFEHGDKIEDNTSMDLVQINEVKVAVKKSKKRNVVLPKEPLPKIDLNKATAHDLEKLESINPKLANRIIKYRNWLGGFVDLKQLKEVYYIPSQALNVLNEAGKIDLNSIKKISVNHSSFKEVLKHPYLNYKQVKKIFSMKRYGNKIASFSQMSVEVDSLNPLLEHYLLFK